MCIRDSITTGLGHDGIGQVVASFHPFSAVAMFVSGIFGDPPSNASIPQPEGWRIAPAALAAAAWIVLPALAVVARMRRAAAL